MTEALGGGLTVAELLGKMSSREFAAWLAFDRLQPIGARRLDLNFAALMTLIAGAFGDRGARFDTFDLFSDERIAGMIAAAMTPRRNVVKAQQAQARAITRALGGRIRKHADDSKP